MANEFTVIGGAAYSDTNGTSSIVTTSTKLDSADSLKVTGVTQNATGAALTWPSATNRIAAAIKNTGATNALLVSLDADSTYPISIAPGVCIVIPLASGTGTVHVKAAASTTTYDAITL